MIPDLNKLAGADSVDLAVLGRLEQDIGRDGVLDLIGVFLDDTVKQLANAQGAAAAGATDKVKSVAHRVKSMGHQLGALGFASRCAEIESACKQGQPLNLVAEVASLQLLFDQARAELGKYAAPQR